MAIKEKQITNDFEKEELVFVVINLDTDNIVTKGSLRPSNSITIQFDDSYSNILVLYNKLNPEDCGLIKLS
ncbi:MAG: hypothetical protein QW806_09990 [Nitrososphaerota archaeon]